MSGTATNSLVPVTGPDRERTARTRAGSAFRRFFTPSARSADSPWPHLHACSRREAGRPAGSYWATCSTCGRLTWQGVQPPSATEGYYGWTVGDELDSPSPVGTEAVQREGIQPAVQASDRRIEWTAGSEHDSAPSVGTAQVPWSDVLPAHGGTRSGRSYYHPVIHPGETPVVEVDAGSDLYTHSESGQYLSRAGRTEYHPSAPLATSELAWLGVHATPGGAGASATPADQPGSAELYWRAEWLKSRQANAPQQESSDQIIVRQNPSVPSTVGR